MSARHARVLIIGSGPAGYTAAIYAARAMLKPVLIQGIQPGGQLTITTDVENYPGFADVIQGPWLMEQMKAQAEHVGTEVISDTITEVELKDKPFWLKGDSGQVYTCDALIICTGAQANWLGLPSEQNFQGFGVSACATCDGFFYRGKKVLVVGGGNTAVEEALFLTNFASEVTVVHRRDEFKAERILQDRLFAHPKIKVIWDTVLDEVLGTDEPQRRHRSPPEEHQDRRHARACRSTASSSPSATSPRPNCSRASCPSSRAAISSPRHSSTATGIPGVFAAGDVTDDVYRQAVTAAGMGCMAALEAEKYLHASELVRKAAE